MYMEPISPPAKNLRYFNRCLGILVGSNKSLEVKKLFDKHLVEILINELISLKILFYNFHRVEGESLHRREAGNFNQPYKKDKN